MTVPTTQDEVKARVKDYILREFLPGEDPEALEDSTSLITGGVLDSLATVKLVTFLEESFGIRFEAYEMGADHLDTLNDIANTVAAKTASGS
jgi:acyl carrier protein